MSESAGNGLIAVGVASALVGATRFGHWVLQHPQPKTGLAWIAVAVVLVVVGLVARSSGSSNVAAHRR